MERKIRKGVLKDKGQPRVPGGNGETDGIKIDFDSIPDHVREELAAATLNSVNTFLQQPGGREFLNKKIALKRAKIEA